MRARILIDRRLAFGTKGQFLAFIKVYEVGKSKKFIDGIKAKYSLVDVSTGALRILIDNHEPYGYHVHMRSPAGKEFRIPIMVGGWEEALKTFLNECERVVKNEDT